MKQDDQIEQVFTFVNDGSRRVAEQDEPEIVQETPEEKQERDDEYGVFMLLVGAILGTMFTFAMIRILGF
ncbi:hypothetical protein [Paenibacillus sp. 1P03SA]|uniref:hypothetical protein n=1 Tax=Paenibacillus sp. 1P03SA TaxID=3132294 RepID=UPI0039A08054